MNILFVCTGNTCRSPMAEGYLKSKNLPEIYVKSRGIAAIGSPVSENAQKVMAEVGIDISEHVSTSLSYSDLASADKIICMSPSHVVALTPFVNPERLFVLNDGILDPYGEGPDVYRECRNTMVSAIDKLIDDGFFTVITVKKLSEENIPDVARLEKVSFSVPWSENSIRESAEHGTEFFVACIGETLAGYVGIKRILDEGYLTNVAVFEQFQRRGVASKLLQRIDSLASDEKLSLISLEVRESNLPAISLYAKFGYKTEGRRKGFYDLPKEDALIMTKRY